MEAMKGTRVLFVITKSNWGGVQAYLYLLATTLASRGMEVAVALGGEGLPDGKLGLLATRLKESGVRIIPVPAFARDINAAHELRAFEQLCGIIKEFRPDVLHVNSSKAGGIGALAGRIMRVRRILFTAHCWAHREPRPFLSLLLIRFASWATILLAHRVIVVSQRDYDDAPVLFRRSKLIVIHNGVSPSPGMSRSAARSALIQRIPELAGHDLWVLMNAELHTNKGIDVAIEALARNPQDTGVLVVIGEGEERTALEARIRARGLTHRVFLLGFVPDARAYLAAADIYLMPSRKEGLPFALLEAGIASLPVIASATGGIPEVITHDKTGILIPVGDSEKCAAAIAHLSDSPADRIRLGSMLHALIERDFSEMAMLEQTLATYAPSYS